MVIGDSARCRPIVCCRNSRRWRRRSASRRELCISAATSAASANMRRRRPTWASRSLRRSRIMASAAPSHPPAVSKDASAPIRCAWPCRPPNKARPSSSTSAPASAPRASCASRSTRATWFPKAGSSTRRASRPPIRGTFYQEPHGTILPLGGNQAYKGFGIGLLLDMLVGGLSGAPCSRPESPPRSANAVLFLLFDSEHFAGGEHFRKEVNDLAANVRGSKPKVGATVTLPGDPERRERTRRGATGLQLDDGTWGQLTALAKELKVAVPV